MKQLKDTSTGIADALKSAKAAGGEKANEVNAQAKKKDTAKTSLQVFVTKSDKTEFQTFCTAHGVKMNTGLMQCFYFVKNLVENGQAEFTAGGIYLK